MLIKPDFSKRFYLSTDSSSYCIDAVLEQESPEGVLKPLAYFSKKLKDAETRYSAYEREALAVVSAIKHFRCYLWMVEFTIYTDNSAVASMYNTLDPIGRISRWIIFLSEFRFEIRYKKAAQLQNNTTKDSMPLLEEIKDALKGKGITNRNKFILVGVEALTRYPFTMTVADQTSVTVIKYLRQLFSIFGNPNLIKCDNGSCFQSQILKRFLIKECVKIEFNVPHQPEWMGLVERMNRTIRYALSKTCYPDYSQWEEALRQSVVGIRQRTSASSGYSPHYLMFGVEATLIHGHELINKADHNSRDVELDKNLLARVEKERQLVSATYVPHFVVGDLVMILDYKIRKKSIRTNEDPRYKGPYEIQEYLHMTYIK
ncbi:Retrovirus-related Pol polyprotein from transposon [Smittium culicis]|uniref:Retrovirus-related Pol polyprotein from transposon n=1 Tax=Smittium culicis TaxID=133412 RepID=A0A1R1YPS2_9FUNG|nr:Retrovirus-related Pol polyprotein from transposon [Smittium culicis]